MRFLFLLSFLLFFLPPAGNAAPAATLTLADGRLLSYRCLGKGTPVTLLEAGWAASSRAFSTLQPKLATSGKVCAFDRAGEGRSSPGPLPRTPDALAQDLHAATLALHLKGPFLLVGHSAGAFTILRFAALYPEEAGALLLIDPSFRGMAPPRGLLRRSENCLALAKGEPLPADTPPPRCGQHPAARREGIWAMRLSELQNLALPEAPLRRYPARILSATSGLTPEAARAKMAAQSALLGIPAEPVASGHLMMFDNPAAILAAAESLRATLQSRK